MPRLSLVLPSMLLVAGAASGIASPATAADDHVILRNEAIKWQPAPKALPPGAEAAVLAGDPGAANSFYVIRAKLPDGYTVAPHTHPTTENVTVISGTLKIGMGEAMNPSKVDSLGPGGFFSAPAKMAHFAMASGPTVIEVSGMGPFEITYINAKDDPRNMVGSSQ